MPALQVQSTKFKLQSHQKKKKKKGPEETTEN
jgi:hypothetical protein